MARRSSPQTNFYINYGPVTTTSAADSLTPVFIAPRYTIHNSAAGNALLTSGGSAVIYAGGSADYSYPSRAYDIESGNLGVVDTSTAVVVFDNPTVKIGLESSGSAVTKMSGAVNSASGLFVVSGGVHLTNVGSDASDLRGGYQLRAGDQLLFGTSNRVLVTNVVSGASVYYSGTISGGSSQATVLTNNIIAGGALVDLDYYALTEERVTISANAVVNAHKDSYLVDSAAKTYVNYRELRQDDVNTLHTAQASEITEWVGEASMDNPLGAMYNAAIQTGYTNFYLMSVASTDEADYGVAIRAAAKNESVYALVPWDQTPGIVKTAEGVLAYYSAPSISQVKRLWLYNQITATATIDFGTAESPATTVKASLNGNTLTLTGGENFTDKGVGVGTLVTLSYYDADSGYVTRTTRVTAVPGTATTCTVAYKNTGATISQIDATFANPRNHTDYAEAIAAAAQAINNHRINYVFAEPTTINGLYCEDPRCLIAELAAMRAAMAPHAPLTDVAIPGASIADAVGFTEDDYKIMNDAGVWVCYRDRRGNMVTRHALTTGKEGTIAEEDSAVSNGDNIVRFVRYSVGWLNGQCNVAPALINKLIVSVYDALNTILSRSYSDLIGPQIIEIQGVDIKQDPNNSAGVLANVNLDLPDVYLDGSFTFNLF